MVLLHSGLAIKYINGLIKLIKVTPIIKAPLNDKVNNGHTAGKRLSRAIGDMSFQSNNYESVTYTSLLDTTIEQKQLKVVATTTKSQVYFDIN